MRRLLIVLPALALLGCDQRPEPSAASDPAPAPAPEGREAPEPIAPAAPVEVPTEAPEKTIEPSPALEADPKPEAETRVAPIPAGDRSSAELSEKMRDRIRFQLERDGGVSVKLDPIIHLIHEDGSSTVYAIGHRSDFEICVHEKGGGKEARKACHAEQAADDLERPMKRTYCSQRSVVRATYGKPKPGKERYGGTLTIDGEVEIGGACEHTRTARFNFEDVDTDGKDELVVDDRSQSPEANFRSGGQSWPMTRAFLIVGDDLSIHASLVTRTHPTEGLGAFDETARRWRFEDRNDDGHPDLVVEQATYLNDGMCDYDTDLWPWPADEEDVKLCKRAIAGELAEDEEFAADDMACCANGDEQVLSWNPDEDAWVAADGSE